MYLLIHLFYLLLTGNTLLNLSDSPGPGSTAEDDSMELWCVIDGVYTSFIQLKGNNILIGEVNIFRVLDFVGGK